MKTESQLYKISTGEYLYSNYYTGTYNFEETNSGTHYSRCSDYREFRPTIVKTDEHLYFNINESGFYLVGDNSFERKYIQEPYGDSDVEMRDTVSLVKLKDDIDLDDGGFTLSHPIPVNEQSHACIYYYYSNNNNEQTFELVIPLEGEDLSLRVSFYGNLFVGQYQYGRDNYKNQIYSFYLSSRAETFESTIGSSYLNPDSASITITESSGTLIKGDFSVSDSNSNNFTGSFEFDFSKHL